MRISLFTILLFASIAFAADWLAVLPITIDGSEAEVGKYLDVSDQAQLDKEIRSQFARALGKCLPVKDRAEVDELLDANYRNCKGDNCVVGVLGKIGARYGVLPSLTVSKARKSVILNLEMASNKNTLPLVSISEPISAKAGGNLFAKMPALVNEAVDVLRMEVPQCAVTTVASPDEGKKPSVTVDLESDQPKVEQAMVAIPAGCFQMGSNDGEDDEKPVHQVCLSAFSMDKYEVTQGQYKSAMGSNPSNSTSCGDNCPVESVDWNQAKAYCERAGKRLPTEAEWEYANRAGSTTKWSCGNDESCLGSIAMYDDFMNDSRLRPVGQMQANAWGLYDMTGNISEWTNDWYDKNYYGQSPSQNPRGPASGSYRVRRGGSWLNNPEGMRSASRGSRSSSDRVTNLGFRCAL